MPAHLTMNHTGAMAGAGAALRAEPVTILAVLAVLLSSVPLFVVGVPPLGDYVSHLAGTALLEHLRHGGFVAQHYRIGSPAVPDLLYDIVVGGLGLVLPVELASKLFLVLTFALLLGGTIFLHRTIHGRISYWPLVAALLLYNWIFLFGFMSYVAGIGLMLVFLAGWLRLAERPWPWRLLLGAVFATVLFLCHLVVLGLYAACLAGLELDRALREQRLSTAAGRLLVGALPFLVPAALYLLASPTRQLVTASPAGLPQGAIVYSILQKLLSPLIMATSGVRLGDLLTVAVLGTAFLLGILAFRARVPRGAALALAMILALFVVAPSEVVPAALIDSRMPLGLFFLGIAAVDLRPRRPAAARLVALLLVALFVARVSLITWQWAGFAGTVRTYEQALERVPDGATLFSARQIGASAGGADAGAELARAGLRARVAHRLRSMLVSNAYEPRLETPWHMTTLAAVRRPIFVPEVFATPGIQLMGLRPAYAPIKELQGDSPVEIATPEELAQTVAAIRAAVARTPAASAPVYLLLQRRDGLEPLALPDGVSLVSRARGVSLLRIGKEQNGRP